MKNFKEISCQLNKKDGITYKTYRYRLKGFTKYFYVKFTVDGKDESQLQLEVDTFIENIYEDLQDKHIHKGCGYIPPQKWSDLTWVCDDHRLSIIEQLPNVFSKNGNQYCRYLCKCVCGNLKEVSGNSLLKPKGGVKSCGCLRKEQVGKATRKHGKHDHKLHSVWSDMKHRCNNPNNKNYHNYGGKGIKVCDAWSNCFINFYSWAIDNGYKEGLSLDRVDGDSGYNPENCRWISIADQARNVSSRSNTGVNGINFKKFKHYLGIQSGYNLPKIKGKKIKMYSKTFKIIKGKEEDCWKDAVEYRLNGLKSLQEQGFLYDVQISKLENCHFPVERYKDFIKTLDFLKAGEKIGSNNSHPETAQEGFG